MTKSVHHEYVPEQTIGAGIAGTVVSARDTKSNTTVAIKVINLASKAELQSYKNEVAVAKRIRSSKSAPSVCEIFDVYKEDDIGYCVMKKYKYDLFDMCFEQNISFSEEKAKRLFKEICIGVKSLHDKGVAHLDLKPENILLDEKGAAYLCDFGSSYVSRGARTISKGQRCIVRDLGVRGTIEYCSPEVFKGEPEYDPFKSDIFSLGVILHVILTQSYPYSDDHVVNFQYSKDLLSTECMDLLQSMLCVCPEDRKPINQILKHPWLRDHRTRSLTSLLGLSR
uniref:Protein kinase domain-containing protein n=1 Tax=Vannella robusta TaxID=1487602 RepID=A0A7S4IVW8_9EUKA|mmetsp:Transcript_9319/g.11513  ORF Transcript_9319/g.11513 Transcript_9319/m.11513 type:complete len:282 (+) Transcript_9319:1-846(+)